MYYDIHVYIIYNTQCVGKYMYLCMFHTIWELAKSADCVTQTEYPHGHYTQDHWLQVPVLTSLSYNNHHFTILYLQCPIGTECFSHAPGSHYVCAVITYLGVNWKHYSIRSKDSANALLISPYFENER